MKILQTLTPIYIRPDELDATIAFYERLFGEACKFRIPLPSLGLEVANVGAIHLITGSEDSLKPFRSARSTIIVDLVADAERQLHSLGATILRGPERGPGGSFLIAQHPEALIVEYIDQAG